MTFSKTLSISEPEEKRKRGKKQEEVVRNGKIKEIKEDQNGCDVKHEKTAKKRKQLSRNEDLINEQTNQKDEFNSTEAIVDGTKGPIKRRYQPWFPSFKQRVVRAFDYAWCPSRQSFAHWVALILVGVAVWAIVFSLSGEGFLPGTQLFSLGALFILAYLAGEVIQLIGMPPLLGMLLMGMLLRNVGVVSISGVYMEITAALREIALCIILTRAGLGLDPKALKSLSFVILRLASLPAFVEGTSTMILTHYMLGLPWLWGALLGSVLAAVSPAVVIPCLFSLQERGYGTDKGIPTLVVAAASLDDIIAISAFGVVLGLIFSTGGDMAMQIVQGPLGILIGIVFGIVWGYIAHYVPHKKDESVVLLRVLMIAGGGLLSIFGSEAIGYQGAGALGCIVAAFVACLGWRAEGWSDKNNPVADVFAVIWKVFQPILFGLIGSEVNIFVLEGSTVGYGVLSLLCSLFARIVISIFIAFGAGFNWKEKVFIAWAWFPKATVQAALGPLALDIARTNGDPELIKYGEMVLIVAVLGILLTAPIGSILISILGPKLLSKVKEPGVATDGTRIPTKEEDEVKMESREETPLGSTND